MWKTETVLVHPARTAVAVIVSVLVAVAITTLVITQSSLGAALSLSWERFIGTALGAAVGATAATYFGPRVFIFGVSIFLLGLLCAVTKSDRSAYRFGGIALTIVLLVPRTGSAWLVAFHRFSEVSIGIVRSANGSRGKLIEVSGAR